MTTEEQIYFEALTRKHARAADVLSESFLSGIWDGLVDKYTEPAHFVYELLQNADDAGASYGHFGLFRDRLEFRHNGTRHFHVTDPEAEKQDRERGTLGDLNSISSAAQSSKKGRDSIGKFGVGFKAVFLYTNTPRIYDPNMAFQLERYIVPVELSEDHPQRKADETLFVFPFDHGERSPKEAFADIAGKLRALVYPTLFLQHLRDVSFEIEENDAICMYEKSCTETRSFKDITARRLALSYTEGDNVRTDTLWLFSRQERYAVGFFLNENGALRRVDMPAFCFFPTREETKLGFILHAPFLLNDSREGIKAGETYNRDMIALLAELAADALFCLREIGTESGVPLIDDDVLELVPLTNGESEQERHGSKVSFAPFYGTMKEAMGRGLLPTGTGYTSTEYAYWSDTLALNSLFSDEQLEKLLKRVGVHWVFRSRARGTPITAQRNYIDALVREHINEFEIFSRIDGAFIAAQSIEWLHAFYRWLADAPRRFTRDLKTKPIFLNDRGEAAAAYDGNGEKTLFLPSENVKGCPTILPALLEEPDTERFLRDVVKLEEPSLQDHIYNTVIPRYKQDRETPPFSYFKLFFGYYRECRATEIDDYMKKIRELDFLEYRDETGELRRSRADALYEPTEMLLAYFAPTPTVHFAALERYEAAFPDDHLLLPFLRALGLRQQPKVYEHRLEDCEIEARRQELPKTQSTAGHYYYETRIEGCMELVSSVISEQSKADSLLLWHMLSGLWENADISDQGRYEYHYRYWYQIDYPSLMARKLREEKWLLDREGSFVSAGEIPRSRLSEDYATTGEGAGKLMEFLRFQEEPDTELTALTALLKFALENREEIEEFKAWKAQKAAMKERLPGEPTETGAGDPLTHIAADIRERARKQPRERTTDTFPAAPEPEEPDRDELTPAAVDYGAKLEREKEKQSAALQALVAMEELQATALSAEKYTYLWFKTLLEMELRNSDADSLNSRQINIRFAGIEKEPDTQKTYVLKQPSRAIPQYMEELADIPAELTLRDGTPKTISIEVASVQSYTLRVKLKDADALTGVELNAVQEISIKARRPVFLLQALKEKIYALRDEKGEPLPDDYDLRERLPANLRFVFGPPGTGKTTYLANELLIPLMRRSENARVLVLTPTNKAADVLTLRIMESMGEDESYTQWLNRFGITGEEPIENSPVFRDKTFDPRPLPRSVTVTTIARFAYDYFMPHGERLYLDALKWDYIVMDEASMIPLMQIIYPLYRKKPKEFIIAGDPFQIEPSTTAALWAGENIYTLVGLHSFSEPETRPYDYPVVRLTTQYRSIPAIGELFSRFTYDGILQHGRSTASRRELGLEGLMDVAALNLLRFPVSRYESIYRPKRLHGSTSYQPYSAIFTMEFTRFLSEALAEKNPGECYTIGIIAPYKAQADLIDRLIASVSIPERIKVQVGTIHGFQGDECDIVLAVLNTPPSISDDPRMFLNKQNILNVAVSRARDCLFVILPDEQTENLSALQKVGRLKALMRSSGSFTEHTSAELEKLMFGEESYIEQNAFATGHQTVNVYAQPEKRYEIRSEDTAVDIQLLEKQPY